MSNESRATALDFYVRMANGFCRARTHTQFVWCDDDSGNGGSIGDGGASIVRDNPSLAFWLNGVQINVRHKFKSFAIFYRTQFLANGIFPLAVAIFVNDFPFLIQLKFFESRESISISLCMHILIRSQSRVRTHAHIHKQRI